MLLRPPAAVMAFSRLYARCVTFGVEPAIGDDRCGGGGGGASPEGTEVGNCCSLGSPWSRGAGDLEGDATACTDRTTGRGGGGGTDGLKGDLDAGGSSLFVLNCGDGVDPSGDTRGGGGGGGRWIGGVEVFTAVAGLFALSESNFPLVFPIGGFGVIFTTSAFVATGGIFRRARTRSVSCSRLSFP